MTWLLLALLQQDKVTASEPVLRATISGGLEFDFVSRDGAIQRSRSVLNGTVGGSTEQLWIGWATVRLDVDLPEDISAVLEIGHWSTDDEADLPFGSNPESTDIFPLEAYVEVAGLFVPTLHFRAGIVPLGYRLRPYGEAFFLDVNDSEPFYTGASTFVRNTADRTVLTPAGVHLRWTIADFMGAEFFWAHTKDGSAGTGDENLFGALLNGLLSPNVSFDLAIALVTGGDRGRVATVGLGIDAYLSQTRWLELFGEVYGQFGRLAPGVGKAAWALAAGSRAHGSSGWLELAFAFRSGDADPEDGSDGGFQSYESVAQFAIVESAMYGLDVDTNVWSVRGAGALRPRARLELRLDAAYFRFHRYVRTAAGDRLSSEKQLGVEIDATASWELASGAVRLRGAFLLGSDFLSDVADARTAWMVAPEISVNF